MALWMAQGAPKSDDDVWKCAKLLNNSVDNEHEHTTLQRTIQQVEIIYRSENVYLVTFSLRWSTPSTPTQTKRPTWSIYFSEFYGGDMDTQCYQLWIHSLVWVESGNLSRAIISPSSKWPLPKLHMRMDKILETGGITSQDSFSFFSPHSCAFPPPLGAASVAVKQAEYQLEPLSCWSF